MNLVEKFSLSSLTFWGSLYSCSYWAAIGIFEPFLNIYLMGLGLDGRRIGFLGMLGPLAQLVIGPWYSSEADRRGFRRRMLMLALVGVSVSLFIFQFAYGFTAILIAMAAIAITRTPTISLGDGLLARTAARHGINYGRMRQFGSMGYALATIIFGWLWQRLGFGWMFNTAAAVFLLVAFSVYFLEEDEPGAKQTQRPLTIIMENRALLGLLLASLLIGGAIYISIIFSGIYVYSLGGGNESVGLLMGISAFLEMPAMVASSKLIQRIGGLQTLLFGYGLLGASFLAMALIHSPKVVLWVGLLRGPGFGLFLASTVILLERNSPPGWAAMVLSFMSAGAFGLAPLISSPLGGFVYDLLGPRFVFILAFAIVILAAITLIVAYGKQPAEKKLT